MKGQTMGVERHSVGRQTARTGDVARALGVSNATVQAFARAGRIPFRLTPGKQYRFNVSDVRTALGREDLTADDLVDVSVRPGGVVVDAVTGYRERTLSATTLSRLRARGARLEAPVVAAQVRVGDGTGALTELVRCSQGVAVAVLHRDLAGA